MSRFLGSGTRVEVGRVPPATAAAGVPEVGAETASRFGGTSATSGTFALVELGYARVSTAKQDLDRQIEALADAGIARERIYVDKKSGATVDRPGLRAVLEHAREGDVIVVHTLDRLGRTVRDTLNMIHELSERGVGVRSLADPIRVDSSRPDSPTGNVGSYASSARRLSVRTCSVTTGRLNRRAERGPLGSLYAVGACAVMHS